MASTALKGTVFAFWLFFPCIFISYCDYRVNHREFLSLVVASQCQMSSDINILYHSYQQFVHITRNGLNTKRSLHFSAYFTFLSILVNFPLTGNDICHSQPKPWYFIISNASRSINLFLAQWRHISSESAVALLLYLCSVSHQIVLISDSRMFLLFSLQNVMPNRRHGIFYCINICGRKSVQ